ncbi:MAG TPA: NAD(+) synthase [Acholeplasmataceae bacterium]|nr:NAD(+) synthase [Acholeplasmataceae bacterium]
MFKNGFIKVAAASPKLRLADPSFNTKEILNILQNLQDEPEIIIFPELAITGYSCGDLFFQDYLYKENLNSISDLLNSNPFKGIVIFGSYLYLDDLIYNCCFVVEGNKILGIIPKTYLPHSHEFNEMRWFTSFDDENVKNIEFLNQQVPFGRMLFTDYKNDFSFSCEVCGDVWAPKSISQDLFLNNALIVFNSSASPAVIGKTERRKLLLNNLTYKFTGAYVYASTDASESSSEVLFGAELIISENGEILNLDGDLSLKSKVIFADIDLDKLKYIRRSSSYYKQGVKYNKKDYYKVNVEFKESKDYNFNTKLEKLPFVPKNTKDLHNIIEIQACSVYKRLNYIGIDKVVLGVSGGLDSTVALLSLCYMCDKFSIDRKNIIGVTLPTINSKNSTYQNALSLMKKLNITIKDLNIDKEFKSQLKLIGHTGKEDVTYENAQARYRTLTLMNIANMEKGIVIGTGDMSEVALGWSTFNGDHMAMYGINSGLPKTVIKVLCIYYKGIYSEISKNIDYIFNEPISPELKSSKQFTEEIIGSYEINDFILYHFLVNGSQGQKLSYLIQNAFNITEKEAKNYVNNFNDRFFKSQYKRLTMPEGVKILEVSLSPRNEIKLNGDTYPPKKI